MIKQITFNFVIVFVSDSCDIVFMIFEKTMKQVVTILPVIYIPVKVAIWTLLTTNIFVNDLNRKIYKCIKFLKRNFLNAMFLHIA